MLLAAGAGVALCQHRSRTPWQVQRERVCAQIAGGADGTLAIRPLRFGTRAFFYATCDRRMSDVVEHGLGELGRRVAGWDESSYLSIELRRSRRQAHRAVRPSASCFDSSRMYEMRHKCVSGGCGL